VQFPTVPHRRARRPASLLLLLGLLFAGRLPAQTPPCRPARGDAAQWLARAMEAAGIARFEAPALGLNLVEMVTDDYESDRPYPPYLYEGRRSELWYFPASGLEFMNGESVDPYGARPMGRTWSSARGTWVQNDSAVRPFPAFNRFSWASRPLDAWAVLRDWTQGPSVKVTGSCIVRDFPRTELRRETRTGTERLYLDPKTGLPVQYSREEDDPMELWGQRAVDYIYATWVAIGPAQYPMASYRMVDGEPAIIRTAAWAQDAKAPVPPALADTADMPLTSPWPVTMPDTVRVSATTWVLHSRLFSNVVTLARDTVFLLDAQWTGEARARQDSTWIARLFPGRHPVVLVVSDLAWPHISGVRSWVAMGASVAAHRSARAFLTRVVQRRWRREPDLLERRRAAHPVAFHYIPVEDSLILAGGAVRVYPINGIGSEGALMTWLPADRFLYPGDYVQSLSGPSLQYAREVLDAAARVGASPERLAAMHLPLTAWSDLVRAARPGQQPTVGLELDPEQLVPGRDSFAILVGGRPGGWQVTALERTASGFRFTERTVMPGRMSQETEVGFDPAGGVTAVRHEGTSPRGATRIRLDYTPGRVRGAVTAPPDSAPAAVDTALPRGALDDNAFPALLAALRWREGASWTFPVFQSGARRLTSWRLSVRGVETVMTAGGPAPCWRAELQQEGQRVTFYVSQAAPHRTLRVVPEGAPVELLATR
jgi:hypothetical protein